MSNNTVSVFACATSDSDQVHHFVKSFQHHAGWDLHIVGMGLKWDSFRTKMKCYRDAMRHVNKKQVVVCLDAYDAICIRDSTNFLDNFYTYQTPILVGYEINPCFTIYNRFIQIGCCPNIDKWKSFHNVSRSKPIYVNSGCIVGYAGEIYKMFDWILNYKRFSIKDDQIGVGLYMNEFPQKVRLDLQEKLVFNDNFGQRLQLREMTNGQLQMDLLTTPYFLHFPGIKYISKKTNYETICSTLLGMEIPLHKTVYRNLSYRYIFLTVLFIFLILFMVQRKK